MYTHSIQLWWNVPTSYYNNDEEELLQTNSPTGYKGPPGLPVVSGVPN